MVDEAGDRAASGIDDHVLVEEHEVVALFNLISMTDVDELGMEV